MDCCLHVLHCDAKLVLCESCSNLCMGVSTDVWIDAEAYISHLSFLSCQFIDDLKLCNTLYIKAEDVTIKS